MQAARRRVAVVAIALAAGAVALTFGRASVAPEPTPGTSVTTAGTATAGSTPAEAQPPANASTAATGASTATPPPMVNSSPTQHVESPPLSTDASVALDTIRRYLSALHRDDFRTAWAMLAAPSQALFSSIAQFGDDRRAFQQSWDDRFVLGDPTHEKVVLETWIPRDFTGDRGRTFVIRVDYPALATNNAGWEIYAVAPDETGRWFVWIAR